MTKRPDTGTIRYSICLPWRLATRMDVVLRKHHLKRSSLLAKLAEEWLESIEAGETRKDAQEYGDRTHGQRGQSEADFQRVERTEAEAHQ